MIAARRDVATFGFALKALCVALQALALCRFRGLDQRPLGQPFLLLLLLLGAGRRLDVSDDLVVDLLAPRQQQFFAFGEALARRQQKLAVPVVGLPSLRVGPQPRSRLEESPVRLHDIGGARPAGQKRFVREPHEHLAGDVLVADQKPRRDQRSTSASWPVAPISLRAAGRAVTFSSPRRTVVRARNTAGNASRVSGRSASTTSSARRAIAPSRPPSARYWAKVRPAFAARLVHGIEDEFEERQRCRIGSRGLLKNVVELPGMDVALPRR